MTETNFGNLPRAKADYRTAKAVVVPVPYERSTTGGKGTASAPDAIIRAADLVESFDEERGIELSDMGVSTWPEVPVRGVFPERMQEMLAITTERLLTAGKFPVLLGGEHTITSGGAAGAARFAQGPVTLVQIDAHADLRETYLDDPYNHACAMRLCLPHLSRLYQVGIRAISKPEFEFVRNDDRIETYIHPGCRRAGQTATNQDDAGAWQEMLDGLRSIPGPVYLTVDMDAFDPGAVPGVGVPEPGGLSWREVTDIVKTVCMHTDVIAADIVELMPIDGRPASEVTAAKLVWRILSYRFFRESV